MGLRYSQDVQDFVRVLSPAAKRAVREALDLIAQDPRHPELDVKQLRKDGATRFLRVRVRNYRIVYSPLPDATYVWRIIHRSEGYAWLERLDS